MTITAEQLEKLYVKKNLSRKEIAEIFKVSVTTIKRYLKKYNIKKTSAQRVEVKHKVMLEKYGTLNVWKIPTARKKLEAKLASKTNIDKENTLNKRKETCIKKYGQDNVRKVKEIKEKVENTCIKKYGGIGLKSKQLLKKFNDIVFKKYNVNNISQHNAIKDKKVETFKRNHNGETYGHAKDVLEKTKQTNLKRYGVSWTGQSSNVKEKIYDTKKKHGTFNTSRDEQQIKELLEAKFKNIKYQYKTKEYPFNCDFYIPSLKLYIEYQGTWYHGNYSTKKSYGPFDSKNPQHIEILNAWRNKHLKSYDNAIQTWTVRDPLKRETAKKNKLNWIEFFNIDQFLNWYNTIQ